MCRRVYGRVDLAAWQGVRSRLQRHARWLRPRWWEVILVHMLASFAETMLPDFPWLVNIVKLYGYRTVGGALQPLWAFLIVRREVERQGRGWTPMAFELYYGGEIDYRQEVIRLICVDVMALIVMTSFWADWVVAQWRGVPAACALDVLALFRLVIWVTLLFLRR